MPKVYIRTYGCQMNERDSEQVSRMFVERGYTMTPAEEEADVILMNTCSVRDQAEQKALGKMGILGRLKKQRPHTVFGYMGCMAQSRGAELLSVAHVDLVAGTQKYHRVVEYVEEIVKKREESQMDSPRYSIVDIGEDYVMMDFNHPMAGVDLHFMGTIVDVREASDEEVQHGHVHGEGGIHHH